MNKLLVITGPTGSGKSQLALELAKSLDAQIVSADSRQVYKLMDIGTAKPSPVQLQQLPHYLLDIISPDTPFSLVDYQTNAYESIDKIVSLGKKPILVGGTGLYVQSIVDGLNIPKVPAKEGLRQELDDLSTDDLIARLKRVDEESARLIPSQNRRRLIRAIEVSEATGQPFSVINRQFRRRYLSLQIGLTAPRNELYRRVDERIDRWIKSGWIEEVARLKNTFSSDLPAMSSVGYRQIGMYLDKKISLEEATRRIKFETHGYIRRQITWFRRDSRIYWIDTTTKSWKEDVVNQINSWYAEEDSHGDQ